MKNILITGAYGGMGREAVKLFAKSGYCVFALDKNVDDLAFEKQTNFKNIIPVKADVTDQASIARAFEVVKSVTDELFAIVHFAGVYMLDSFMEIENESLENIFKINFLGAVLINKTFMPLLKSGSRIIMTTSELAPLNPLPFTGIYAVTKGALDKYAYSLRMELQLLKINVSVLRAGAVKTGMLGDSTKALARFCDKTQLYKCNAERFKKIVDRVETKCVEPEKIAIKVNKILNKKNAAFAYSINANFALKLLSALPKKLQFYVIRKILK